MLRLVLIMVALVAGSAAEAQLRPPGSVGGPPGPPPPQRGWFFFDLFAPRRPAAPQVITPRAPQVAPRSGAPKVSGGQAPPTTRKSSGGSPGSDSGDDTKDAAAPTTPPPPYETDLMRVAEIMGALHYLRPLCGAPEKERWRTEMQALIEAEAATEDRKDRLTRTFNRGYASFERTYHSCTPAAHLVVERYLAEGSKLTHDIVARYSN